MRVVFRSDASLAIGTGHVMRCLTLAEALRRQGAVCRFVCRAHPGQLVDHIKDHGFAVSVLPLNVEGASVSGPDDPYSTQWLGTDWATDAQETCHVLKEFDARTDWLVVDHYGLDSRWERALRPYVQQVMCIDDLANRPHDCDLLLDQNLGRQASDYVGRVPDSTELLIGSTFALLRPEFAQWRARSLQRRQQPSLKQLLITLGGVDNDNVTGQVLQALSRTTLPPDCGITVVMGATAPHLDEVLQQSQGMPWPTMVQVAVRDMAPLMAESDLAIGAAGSTSWERCCLGVPTIMFMLAENQHRIAKALSEAGAAHLVALSALKNRAPFLLSDYFAPQVLCAMSIAAAEITDGLGVTKVVEVLIGKEQHAN